jgi:UDP-N-acetylglucosamine:LPS N-acetylglucosamine transferase
MKSKPRANVLAVASSGGHWQQLLLVSEAFMDLAPVFVTTKQELLDQAGITSGYVVNDCNRDQPLLLTKNLVQMASLVFRLKPRIVISTGAAPGIICMAVGKLIGAKTIWIDSFANVEQLSMSGKMARYLADAWITQWEHLSYSKGPSYKGALL